MGNRPNRHWNHLHLAHKLENYLPNHTCTLISASVFCILQHIRLSKIFSHKTQVQRGKAYCGKDRFCQLEEIQRVHSQVTTRLLIENGKLWESTERWQYLIEADPSFICLFVQIWLDKNQSHHRQSHLVTHQFKLLHQRQESAQSQQIIHFQCFSCRNDRDHLIPDCNRHQCQLRKSHGHQETHSHISHCSSRLLLHPAPRQIHRFFQSNHPSLVNSHQNPNGLRKHLHRDLQHRALPNFYPPLRSWHAWLYHKIHVHVRLHLR